MAKYLIEIESVDSDKFFIFKDYVVTLHFKNPNGSYANDPRLPHGHRQKVFINKLPFTIEFEFPDSGFFIENIRTVITIIGPDFQEYGEISGPLNVGSDASDIINMSVVC